MFEVYCPAHGAHVLLSPSRILDLQPCDTGLIVEWRCWCDHRGRSLAGRRPVRDEPRDCPPGWPAAS